MYSILADYMRDTFHQAYVSSGDRFDRVTMQSSSDAYFQVHKLRGRILFECGFTKHCMKELATADCVVKLEPMKATMRLARYSIPMTLVTIPGGAGFVRFDVTDFDEAKLRALADHMLWWFPREFIRDWDLKRRLALGMALHPRLGRESALGRMGSDALQLVVKYDT